MAFLASLTGARRQRPQFFRTTRTSRTFRKTGGSGRLPFGAAAFLPRHFFIFGTTHFFFERSRRYVRMSPSLLRLTTFAGQGRRELSKTVRHASYRYPAPGYRTLSAKVNIGSNI